MATLTIRQLVEKTKTRLRIRAARHGCSMESEAREILRSVLTTSAFPKGELAERIHRPFAAFGGVDSRQFTVTRSRDAKMVFAENGDENGAAFGASNDVECGGQTHEQG